MTTRLVDQLLPALLARASHMVSREFYERLRRRNIPVRRWRLLGLLWDGGALTIGELSDGILISQSSTTRLVDRAVEDGLVRKSQDDGDRRKTFVRITDAGRDYIGDLVDDALRVDHAIGKQLETGKAEMLKAELRDLIARLERSETHSAGTDAASASIDRAAKAKGARRSR